MTSHQLEGVPLLPGSEIAVLTPDAVPQLRVSWHSRFTTAELTELARAQPSLSVWNQRTGEFLVGGRWRNRRDVASVAEIAATSGAIDLIDAFCTVAQQHGIALAVASEQVERRRTAFYVGARFEPIEDIIIYEMSRVRARAPRSGDLRFVPLQIENLVMLEELIRLDNAAFPWLWWNSEDEFREYASAPGVEIQVGYDESRRAVAYVGTTRFRNWGHLDRIAVNPEIQGRGLGRVALDFAVSSLASAGASRVGLSTQSRNVRSRALYESYGFHRSSSHDYRVFGRLLDPELTFRDIVG
ncbi:MAG: GNAT family N-acetyltransferase [Thermomicrobiales bacterium]|nr:GNAT family N-acetyltransferase [Thermomicrobiales bacterium]